MPLRSAQALFPFRPDRRRAFTLVELLVVIGIIAVLMGILFPVLRQARESAAMVRCQSNLRQIGVAVTAYGVTNRWRLPTKEMLGSFPYRLPPGERNDYDPNALRERYGLASILHGVDPNRAMPDSEVIDRGAYLDGLSEVWVCPSQSDKMKAYRNTYSFSIATEFPNAFRKGKSDFVVAWDNYVYLPGPSGFSGPFPGFTIPLSQRVIAHKARKMGKGIVCELQLGGHVDARIID
jgi:prepilin-type N-terminal cleavage/methylation domain-containing protein